MRKLCILIALLAATSATCAAPKEVTIRSLKILAAVYRGAPGDKDRLDDAALEGTLNGIKLGRLFYFRNSRCKLNLDITYLVIDTPAPKNDGPTYDYIVKDLQSRGVKDNQYDGMFCTGVGFTGNWGGFRVFGNTGACFGGTDRRGDFTWCPEDKPDVWYGTAWTFVHEFQHALDSPICSMAGHPEMMSDHPYSDSMEGYFSWGHHAGMHWDWVAHTLSSFQDFLDVRGATDSTITVVDADDDGLPDDDARLPTDEKRFGSDVTKADTDGDGLSDLQEFRADIYRSSDPRSSDTDGDGMPDSSDPNPTVALAQSVRYSGSGPSIDGKLDACYGPFTTGMYAGNAPDLMTARMHACWNEDALYLFVKSKAQCSLDMLVDSSADNGFWEGGDTYPIRVTPDGKVAFTDLGLTGDVPGAKAAWGSDGLEVMIPALIGQGVSNEINFGSARRPEDTTDGMVLLDGRKISFNLALSAERKRALITPNWSMFDIVLAKSASDPPRPSLRFTRKMTRDAQPVVSVVGVGSREMVTVVDSKGKAVGERMGPGQVILTGKLNVGSDAASGANVLIARARGSQSQPFTLVVDSRAEPPNAIRSSDGRTLKLSGEPRARADIFAGAGDFPIWPVGSVDLDGNGAGEFTLSAGGSGFAGHYGLGQAFDAPLFVRIDQEIKFDYEGGVCDPRLSADGFCIRWTGYLDVKADGDYTFWLSTDDGSRLYVDGAQVIDYWGHHGAEERSTTLKLAKGEHELRLDYYEDYGWASAHLEWSGPGVARTHSLPVHILPYTAGKTAYFCRQTDAAGNESIFARF